MLASSITYDNTFSGFTSITELANSLHFTDSTPDIPEDLQKAMYTAAALSFGSPAFEKTPCIISLIEQIIEMQRSQQHRGKRENESLVGDSPNYKVTVDS